MRRGFTLVELSIVLVIIGLLVGGVLAGQSLIRGAEQKAMVSQSSKIQTAILAFKDKYFYLPGDMPNATAFWNSASQPDKVTNGNGDGILKGTSSIVASASTTNDGWGTLENGEVFEELALAGLMDGATYDQTVWANYTAGIVYPMSKFQSYGTISPAGGGGIGSPTTVSSSIGVAVGYEYAYLHIHGGHKLRWTFSSYSPALGNPFFYAGLTPEEAWNFDTKLDDGLPLSGKFYITAASYIYRVPGDANNELNNRCIVGATNVYKLTSSVRDCYVDLDAPF